MGTKVSKKQGEVSSQKVAAVTAFTTAGKGAQMKRMAALTKKASGKKLDISAVIDCHNC